MKRFREGRGIIGTVAPVGTYLQDFSLPFLFGGEKTDGTG